MPKPKNHEKKNDFIRRCVHELVHAEGRKPKEAVAVCYVYWNEHAKKALVRIKSELMFYKFLKGQNIETILAVCPRCGLVLDYTAHKEAGMGYIKCPSCKREITQEHIREVN
jgi:predicted Zn-ribbon and HTH transcriptional regulator